MANVSGSNDPHQVQHDVNELILSAERVAEEMARAGVDADQATDNLVQRLLASEGLPSEITKRELVNTTDPDYIDEYEAAYGREQSDLNTYNANDFGYVVDEETGAVRRSEFIEDRGQWVGEETIYDTKRPSMANLGHI